MSTLSKLETKTSLQDLSNESQFETKKINKIRKSLLNMEKEEVVSFSPLKVKIYNEKIEDQKEENKIKIPMTFKSYFEDFKRYREFTNHVESGIVTQTRDANSIQTEQIDSSDLVDSE